MSLASSVPTMRAAAVEPQSKYFRSQGLKLHYLDWGNETKPLLVLVHGGRDHGRSWDWVARAFRDQYHVIAPDLRGHGESEWGRGVEYSALEVFTDLAVLLESIGKFPLTLIGHSFGGTSTAHYAGTYPERIAKYVGADSLGTMFSRMNTHKPPPEARFAARMAKVIELEGKGGGASYQSVEEAWERLRNKHTAAREDIARHFIEHGLRRGEDGNYRWKYDPMFALAPLDFSYREADALALWARISCPVLFVCGLASMFKEPWKDPRMNAFRDPKIAFIEGAGHQIHHDKPDEFERIVRQFLHGG